MDDLLKVIDTTLQKRFSDPVNEDPRDTLVLRRSIKLLNSVLKEFSNAKMLNSVRTMGSASSFPCPLSDPLELSSDPGKVTSRVLWLLLDTGCDLSTEHISRYNFSASEHRYSPGAFNLQMYRKIGYLAVESPRQRREGRH